MPTTVKFGNTAATNVVVKSPTELTCTIPAGSGEVDVTVTTDAGQVVKEDAFTYSGTLEADAPATG